jgi:hypothetical protein
MRKVRNRRESLERIERGHEGDFVMAEERRSRITKEDLEKKFREIGHQASGTAGEALELLPGFIVGGVLLVAILAYLFGRRRGKRHGTVVEIRRN